MGVVKQFGLLLKQNLLERKRRWGITILELGWPIVLLITIVIVRDLYPITNVKECKYEPRAMPSSGIFPFAQSYVCNLNAKPKCMDDDEPNHAKLRSRTNALRQVENALAQNHQLFAELTVGLQASMPALEQFSVTLAENPAIGQFLNTTSNLFARDLFNDPDKLRNNLVSNYGIDPVLVDTILDSKVNFTKGIDLLKGIDAHLCNGTNGTVPLLDYLVPPEGASLQAVNEELCSMQPEQLADLIELLQRELDPAALVNLITKLMSVFTPDASQIIEDIGQMIEIVKSLASFQGLAEELPSVAKALDFATRLLSFVQRLVQNLPVTPEQISSLVEQLDPLITRWSNNSQEWQDFRRGMYYLNAGLVWVSNALDQLPHMKISFGDLYTDGGRSVLDFFNETSADAEYLIDVFSRSAISLEKFLKWQGTLYDVNEMDNETLCQLADSFFDVFIFSDMEDEMKLKELLDRNTAWYCRFDPKKLVMELSNRTNFASFMYKLAGYGTVGSEPLNWKSLISSGWELVNIIIKLEDYFLEYAEFFQRLANLDMNKVVAALRQSFLVQDSRSGTTVTYQSIINFMDYIELMLKATPVWPHIRTQVIYQNLFAGLVNNAANLTIEAINITRMYMSRNGTEQFMLDFITLTPPVQSQVVHGLTRPHNVKAMLKDPDAFIASLCSNMTGLLNLNVDSATENELSSMFCGGDFVTPPGLSKKIKAIGVEIENKVDLLVQAFENPSSLSSSDYDSVSALSQQLIYNIELNELIQKAAIEMMYAPAAQRLAERNTDWQRYITVLPYAITATAMDVLGEALEESDAWSSIAPYIQSIDYTAKFISQMMRKQRELLNDQHMVGRVVDWILRYGPQKLTLTVEAMKDPQKMAKVMELLMGDSPLDILQLDCDPALQDWFYGKGALDGLNMQALKNDVCEEHMQVVVYAEVTDVFDTTNYWIQIREIAWNGDNSTMDWVDMTATVADMPTAILDSGLFYDAHFRQYDWDAWADAINVTITSLTSNPMQTADMLEQLDVMFANFTEWRITKHVVHIADVLSEALADQYTDIAANGLRLSSLFANSTKIRDYLIEQNDLSPDIVDAFFSTIIDPTQMFAELITGNFTNREFCKDIFISQFIDFKDSMVAQRVDDLICKSSVEFLSLIQSDKLSSAVNQAVLPLAEGLMYNNLTDITIDYEMLVTHIGDLVQAVNNMRNFTGPFFPDLVNEFNITADVFQYQASFDRFLSQNLSHWPAVLDGITKQLKETSNLNDIGLTLREVWKSVSVSVQQNLYGARIALQQLRNINQAAQNSNGDISLKDLVLPGQLRNVLEALENAPEMTDTLLYSLIQLASNPLKLATAQLSPNTLDLMCTNQTVFNYFFELPPDSATTLGEMQTSMCSLKVNVTILLREMVENIDGFEELLHLTESLANPNGTLLVDDLFTAYYNISLSFSASIEQLVQFSTNYNQTLTFEPPRWLREDVWADLGLKLQNYTSALQNISQADAYAALLYSFTPMIDQFVNNADNDTRRALVATTAVFEYMLAVFEDYKADRYNDSQFLDGLQHFTVASDVFKQLPNLFESAMITGLRHPQKVEEFVRFLTQTPSGTPAEIFCGLTEAQYLTYFVLPPGGETGLKELQTLICFTRPDQLLEDLRLLPGGDTQYFNRLEMILNGTVNPPPFSSGRLFQLSNSLYQSVYDLVMHYSTNIPALSDLLQAEVWSRVVRDVSDEINRLQSTPFNPYQLLSFFQAIDINQLAPEMVPYIHTALAIAKVTLRKLEPLNQTSVDVADFFQSYPLTTKAMETLNISLDVVELLMTGANSLKFQLLLQKPSDEILPTLCGSDWADYFHVGPAVDLQAIKSFVCNTNWTSIYKELITELEISYIESQLANNSTIDWLDVFDTVNSMQQLISDVIALKPTFKYYPWMNETGWQLMMERVGRRVAAQYTSWEFQLQSMLASLAQMAPMLEQLIGNDTNINLQIYQTELIVKALVNIISSLSESDWDLPALFSNTTEMKKVLTLADQLPGYVDIILQTALQPEKVAPLIKDLIQAGNNSLAVFCGKTDLTQYVVYDNKTDLDALQNIICSGSFDLKKLEEEIIDIMGTPRSITAGVLANKTVVADLLLTLSESLTKLSEIFNGDLSGLQTNLPYWIQPEVWRNVFNRFATSLNSVQGFDVLRILNLLELIGGDELLGSLELPQLHVANAVMDVIIEKLELFNRTEVNITTIVESSPSAVKALGMLQYLPDIIQILSTSISTPQFTSLLEMQPRAALTALCGSNGHTYLSAPPAASVDMDKVLTEFCSNNWTAVANELISDVDYQHIAAQMNNTSPVDLKDTSDRVTRISELIQYLIANPPRFVVDPSWTWLNATVWDEVLLNLNQHQAGNVLNMISSYFYGILVPLFGDNPEFNKFGVVLDNLLASIKYELSLWNRPSQNVTVGDILAVDSDLGDFITKALELSPEMYSLFLSVSIRNPFDLQIIYTSSDPQALICDGGSKFLDNLDVPAEVDMVQVKDFICSTNFTVLITEIIDRFNIPQIVAALQSNVTVSANWTKIQTELTEVVSLINQLINDAPNVIPPFDVNEFGKIVQEITRGVNWASPEIYLQMTESLVRYLSSQPFWEDIKPYFQLSQVVQGWIADVTSRIIINPDLSINLADLFPNATLLHEYIQASLALDDETAFKLATGITIKLDKYIALLIPTASNSSALIDLFCDPVQFADIFSVPNTVQVNDLSGAICNMVSDYGSTFVDQLEKSFGIDQLISKINNILSNRSSVVIDIRETYQQQQQLIGKIISLANVTDVLYNDVDLRERFALFSNETVLQKYLLLLTQSLPEFDLKTMGDALNGMMPLIRTQDWWTKAEPYFRMMNVLAEIGANRTARLPAVNLTLNTLIRDGDAFRKLLSDVFAFTPDLFESLLSAELSISPAELISVNSTTTLQDLLCTAKFPANMNVTAVKVILCDTNFQLVLDEMLSEFDFDLVIQEIGKIDVYSNVSSDFDWNDLLSNTNDLARNLGLFFTQLQPPPVADFFLYEGNMTVWLEKISQALISSSDPSTALKKLASALSVLESSLSGKSLSQYQQVVFAAQAVQNYLDLAISELSRFKDTVSLRTIFKDNTQLINLVNVSFAAAPELTELFLTQPMSVSKLTEVFLDPSVDPCTVDLSQLFSTATPADVKALRDLFCSVNFTVLFSEIRKELIDTSFSPLWKAIASDNSTFDWSGYLDRFTELSDIIGSMVKSPPRISPGLVALINTTEYLEVIDRVQKYWTGQQFSLDANIFSQLMSSLDPLLSSSEFGQQMSKFINVANIILSRVNSKLADIKNNDVSLDTLLGDASELKTYLEKVVNLSPQTVATIMISQPSGDALRLLVTGRVSELCNLDAGNILILPEGVPADVDLIKNIFCDANVTIFLEELKAEFDISDIISTLSSNTSESVDWARLFNNSQELSAIIAYLAGNDPVIDQSLVEAFNFSRYAPVWESLKEYDPRNLLRLLDAYSPLIRDLAGENWPVFQTIIYQYSTSFSEVQRQLADLVNSGFTVESLLRNRTALTEFFSKISESSFDQAELGYEVMYKGQMTALLQRPEIQVLLCNETAIRTLMPHLPAYVDLTSLFCNVRDESWLPELKARNYTITEVIALTSAIDSWYLNMAFQGKYNFTYIYSYKKQISPDLMNVTLGDLAQPVKELIDVLENFGTIPPQFFPNFNASYWMPLIDALVTGYVENIPQVVIKTLELLDPLLRNEEFWQQMKLGLGTATQYMKWINDKLELLNQQGQTINITTILPPVEDVKSLLENVISPKSASEFLSIGFNPEYLLYTLQHRPVDILCDAYTFNTSFSFPSGVDVEKIQQDLCNAARNDSLVIEQIWRLFDMQKLVKEISRLTDGSTPTTPATESPFRAFLKQAQRFLQSAHLITRLTQAVSRGQLPDISSYVNMLLTTVNTFLQPDSNNIGGMCDAVVELVDEVPEYVHVEPYLVRIQLVQSIVAQVFTSVDEFDDFLCELPSMNMSTLIGRVIDTELLDEILLVDNPEYLAKTRFMCSAAVRDSMIPQEKIRQMVESDLGSRYEFCIKKLMTENFTLANDVNAYVGLISGLRELLKADSFEAVRPFLEQLIDALLSPIQASRINSLVNQTAIDNILQDIFKGSTISTNDFVNTFVNVDELLALLNQSSSVARGVVCDAKKLEKIVLGDVMDVQDLSRILCADSSNLRRLLQAIASNLNHAKLHQLAATKSIEGFINQLVAYLTELMDRLNDLALTPDLLSMFSDFDFSTISALMPKLSKIFNSGNNLDGIVDSLLGIVDLVESRIVVMTNNTEIAKIFEDVKTVINGVRGLRTIRDSLKMDIPLTSIFTDSNEIADFLRNSTNLSEKDIADLLASNFTSSFLASNGLAAPQLVSDLCDPQQLRLLLTLPKTSTLSYEQASQMICEIDSKLGIDIGAKLVKEMGVSEMIANFVSERFGVHTAELRRAVQLMAPLQEDLSDAFNDLTGATEVLFVSASPATAPLTSQDGQSQPNQPLALESLSVTSVFCGQEISGYDEEKTVIQSVDFESPNEDDKEDEFFGPGGKKVKRSISLDFLDDSDESSNIIDLNKDPFFGMTGWNVACDGIRRNILRAEGGRFIWSFLKPLFVGKVLYTPVNNVTRDIVRGTNASFDEVSAILNSVKSIVATENLLKNQFENDGSYDAFTESLRILKDVDSSLISQLLDTNFNFKSWSEQLSLFTSPRNQALFTLLSSVLEYADCVSLDRFVGVESENELEKMASKLHEDGEFIAGLVFMNTEGSSGSRGKRDLHDNLPKHVEYKIRMDIDNVESTLELKDLFYSAAPRDNLLYDLRYLRGFVQLQEMVDRSITKLQLGGRDNSISQTETLLQMMPATCYNDDVFMGYVYPYIVPIVMTLSWLFAVAHAIKTLTAYRETGLEELMKIMGLKGGVIWCAWFINTYIGMVFLSVLAIIFLMVGKVLIVSNGIIVFLYLLMFSLSSTMFCYMVGAFFSRANVAAAVGVMLYFISYLPYIIYTQFREDYTQSLFHISSLLSTTAFAIGATYISRWEQMGDGIHWNNIDHAPGYNEDSELSVQWMFLWMLIDSFIYLLIGWYVRNVKPGKFGQGLPFYFPFTKSYWGFGSARRRKIKSKGKRIASNSSPNDADFSDLPIGISIEKLKKVYSKGKVAVDNLDTVFYEGHITAFLGRNGAGKTTTINMLTGITPATSGSAVVNGWDIDNGGMNNIRENLGYCPQFDMLFDFLTVEEHLELFASLKSSDPPSILKYDIDDMLHNIGLWSARHETVGTLSGGMRRRLSVAIAFIGNSKVIILDEPTSSIDPNGRRAIWDIILKNRNEKTIVLCTHHLDEADILGDRVVVVDNGRLRAEGSPMSLKRQHGSGYQLFLEKVPTSQRAEVDVNEVTEFIQRSCPSALLMTNIGSSLTYTLPTTERGNFDALFAALDENMAALGIAGFGVSDSTLYEVFEKITDRGKTTSSPEATSQSQTDFGKTAAASSGGIFAALFRKRLLHTIKDFKTYIALILLPCLFVALALGVNLIVPDRTNQPSLKLDPALYPNTYSFYSDGHNLDGAEAMASTLRTYPGVGTACMPGRTSDDNLICLKNEHRLSEGSAHTDPLPVCTCSVKAAYDCKGDDPQLDTYTVNGHNTLVHIKDNYTVDDYLLSTYNYYKAARYGGWSFDNGIENQTEASVWFDNRAFHSSAAYLNALSNMIVRAAVAEQGLSPSEYGITVYNHPLIISPQQLSVKNALEQTADLGVSLTFLVAFSFIPAGLCVYLVLENIQGEKHLQYVSGVGPIRYWVTSYLWDMLVFLIPIGLCLALMAIFGIRAYIANNNLLSVFLLLVAYAWAVLPFMYMTIKIFKNTTTAFFTLLMVNLFLGVGLSTITFLLNFFRLSDTMQEMHETLKMFFLIFPQYSFTSALIQLNVNQALVDILARFDTNLSEIYHPFDEKHGIVWNLVALAVQGVVFSIITMLTELKVSTCSDRISSKSRHGEESDNDVLAEKERVNSHSERDAMLVKGLSKQYRLHSLRRVVAVDDLSFGVQPGEIFGLCGVNGAGKTTTFRMLTGEVVPSEGMATLHGKTITNSDSRRKTGYCPQINSLDSLLTCRQTLHVYAQLKNISDAEQVVESIISSFGMTKYANKQVSSMSGGMKRNLCVAIGLLGNPDLIFLDEPSAGMDPVARRTVWDQILAAAARGSAVVLTSHSMTECEALCTRIAIMLNGKLACLGSSQHLKNKFGLGYTMKVKVNGPLPHSRRVIDFVTSKWPRAAVKDHHLNTIEFSIPETGGQTLASLFSLIEHERHDLYIEEYSLFQTTLDQVFIQFARSQQDQIDSSEDGSDSSSDTESSPRYVANTAFTVSSESIVLNENEKTTKTLNNLDGEQAWSTYL